ncbi:Uncharacterised protein [Mycobacteroides abscessus subsp. abscessus]|uniref:hypothetical protein n=1 Tax=Mycobacteroides abscessus TaxID=36809 RepID=UPI0009C4C296|nr:hypothetical protein [Mycobacteroides abscessus]SKM36301.1 Uncharacterised protein [Mycobacteroides abscessus subsp. abscessus]
MNENENWDDGGTDITAIVMPWHPGVSDEELSSYARTFAGQLELVYGCDVYGDVCEVVESALLICRNEMRRVIDVVRDDAQRVADHGVDTVAELRAIESSEDADRAEHAMEEHARVAEAIERLTASVRPGTTHAELVAMVRAAEALNLGRLPGLFDALTAARDRLAAAVDMVRPLMPPGCTAEQVRALVAAAERFGGQSLPGVDEALLGVVTPWSPYGGWS